LICTLHPLPSSLTLHHSLYSHRRRQSLTLNKPFLYYYYCLLRLCLFIVTSSSYTTSCFTTDTFSIVIYSLFATTQPTTQTKTKKLCWLVLLSVKKRTIPPQHWCHTSAALMPYLRSIDAILPQHWCHTSAVLMPYLRRLLKLITI
jgi:hypothetical protein